MSRMAPPKPNESSPTSQRSELAVAASSSILADTPSPRLSSISWPWLLPTITDGMVMDGSSPVILKASSL